MLARVESRHTPPPHPPTPPPPHCAPLASALASTLASSPLPQDLPFVYEGAEELYGTYTLVSEVPPDYKIFQKGLKVWVPKTFFLVKDLPRDHKKMLA